MGDVATFLTGEKGTPGQYIPPEIYHSYYGAGGGAGAGGGGGGSVPSFEEWYEQSSWKGMGSEAIGLARKEYNKLLEGGGLSTGAGGGPPISEEMAYSLIQELMGKETYFDKDYEATQYDLLRQQVAEGLEERGRSLEEISNRGGVYAQGPHLQNWSEMLMKGQEQYGRRAGEMAVATAGQRAQEDFLRRQMALGWAQQQKPYALTGGATIPGSPGSGGLLGNILGGAGEGAGAWAAKKYLPAA